MQRRRGNRSPKLSVITGGQAQKEESLDQDESLEEQRIGLVRAINYIQEDADALGLTAVSDLLERAKAAAGVMAACH